MNPKMFKISACCFASVTAIPGCGGYKCQACGNSCVLSNDFKPQETKIGTITKEIFEEHFREDKPQEEFYPDSTHPLPEKPNE